MNKTCAHPGCSRLIHRNGPLCQSHRKRLLEGDINRPIADKAPNRTGPCSFDGCGRKVLAKGLCSQHYTQKSLGKELTPIRDKAPNGTGWVNEDGYLQIGGKLQHRTRMEEHIGRALLPNESVHHKNGVRLDNEIKNLELWVSTHPSGQRVEDRIADAVAFLKFYAPHLLK